MSWTCSNTSMMIETYNTAIDNQGRLWKKVGVHYYRKTTSGWEYINRRKVPIEISKTLI